MYVCDEGENAYSREWWANKYRDHDLPKYRYHECLKVYNKGHEERKKNACSGVISDGGITAVVVPTISNVRGGR